MGVREGEGTLPHVSIHLQCVDTQTAPGAIRGLSFAQKQKGRSLSACTLSQKTILIRSHPVRGTI